MKKLIILALLLIAIPVQADRMFIVLPVQGGDPAIGQLTKHGSVLIEMFKTTGLYMVTGKAAELTALSALTKAQAITKVTDIKPTAISEVKPEEVIAKGETDPVATAAQWAELDTKPVKADVDKLNALLTAESTGTVKPQVTVDMTYREVLTKMVANKDFERTHWVKDE